MKDFFKHMFDKSQGRSLPKNLQLTKKEEIDTYLKKRINFISFLSPIFWQKAGVKNLKAKNFNLRKKRRQFFAVIKTSK